MSKSFVLSEMILNQKRSAEEEHVLIIRTVILFRVPQQHNSHTSFFLHNPSAGHISLSP